MKNKILPIVLLLCFVFTSPVFAEHIILNDNFEAYSETQVPARIKNENTDVATFLKNGEFSSYSICEEDGNKSLKAEISGASSNAVMYLMPSKTHIEETKGIFTISFRVKMDSNARLQYGLRSGNNDTLNVFIIENNTLKPIHNNVVQTSSELTREIVPGEFHSIKLIFDTQNSEFILYCDGEKIGERFTMRTNVNWAELGLFYNYINFQQGTAAFPCALCLDDVFVSFLNDDFEISSSIDFYSGSNFKQYLSDADENPAIGMDFINRTDESKEYTAAFIKYGKNDEGYSYMNGYNFRKISLKPGINRIMLDGFPIPEEENSTRLFLINNLLTGNLELKTFELANNSGYITID